MKLVIIMIFSECLASLKYLNESGNYYKHKWLNINDLIISSAKWILRVTIKPSR